MNNDFSRADLPAAERRLYTERLLKLHRILATEENIAYRHTEWVKSGRFKFDGEDQHTCGTAACALGHAMARDDVFPDLPRGFNRDGLPLPADWLEFQLGNQKSNDTFDYFGPRTFQNIFALNAYYEEYKHNRVTRQMACDRIIRHITKVLGCEPVLEE